MDQETTIVLGGEVFLKRKTTDSTQAATPSEQTPQRPSMLLMLGFALLGGMIPELHALCIARDFPQDSAWGAGS